MPLPDPSGCGLLLQPPAGRAFGTLVQGQHLSDWSTCIIVAWEWGGRGGGGLVKCRC